MLLRREWLGLDRFGERENRFDLRLLRRTISGDLDRDRDRDLDRLLLRLFDLSSSDNFFIYFLFICVCAETNLPIASFVEFIHFWNFYNNWTGTARSISDALFDFLFFLLSGSILHFVIFVEAELFPPLTEKFQSN